MSALRHKMASLESLRRKAGCRQSIYRGSGCHPKLDPLGGQCGDNGCSRYSNHTWLHGRRSGACPTHYPSAGAILGRAGYCLQFAACSGKWNGLLVQAHGREFLDELAAPCSYRGVALITATCTSGAQCHDQEARSTTKPRHHCEGEPPAQSLPTEGFGLDRSWVMCRFDLTFHTEQSQHETGDPLP
jgi:hypothetical protein